MNERIQKLAEQAGLKQRIWNSLGKELPMWQEDPDNPGLAKFAELIVRQCAKVADDGFASSNFGNGITGHQLLQHFGVEE